MSLASWWFNKVISGGGVPGFTDMTDGFVIPLWYNRNPTSAIQSGSYVMSVESTEKKRQARLTANTLANTPVSLTDIDDNVVFTVTSGKTARVVLSFTVAGATSDVEIWDGTTLDTADGTLLKTMKAIPVSSAVTTPILNFTSGSYITVKATHASGIIGQAFSHAWIAELV